MLQDLTPPVTLGGTLVQGSVVKESWETVKNNSPILSADTGIIVPSVVLCCALGKLVRTAQWSREH